MSYIAGKIVAEKGVWDSVLYIEMKSRGTAFLCCYYLSLLDGSPRRGEHEEYQELLQPRSLLTLTPIFLDVIGGSRLTSRLG